MLPDYVLTVFQHMSANPLNRFSVFFAVFIPCFWTACAVRNTEAGIRQETWLGDCKR
jgi:hypothetical protein